MENFDDEQLNIFDNGDLPEELTTNWDEAFSGGTDGGFAETVSDGLVFSLNNLGRVDIKYISSLCGVAPEEVVKTLKGCIFQNPETYGGDPFQGWETADSYLSGNVLNKLTAAILENSRTGGQFSENVAALEEIFPDIVKSGEIYATLGSSWIPPDIIDDFIEETFGSYERELMNTRHRAYARQFMGVTRDSLTGIWNVPAKSYYNSQRKWVKMHSTYGTVRMDALHILEKSLNMKQVAVYDTVKDPYNPYYAPPKRVLNKEETMQALEKQKALCAAFESWLWKNEKRRERLENEYNDKFGYIRVRRFNGSFLTFPEMSKDFKLYPYQKNAVARIIFTPNTLLAHDVGAGKTYVMIAAAMEMRRMNISNQNLFVVPNSVVGQWRSMFTEIYPNARILVVEPKHFTPAKKQKTLYDIQTGGYDGVIMPYSCFTSIPLSKKFKMDSVRQELEDVTKACKQHNPPPELKRRRDRLTKEYKKLLESPIGAGICFDELNVTTLFVDEAHNFKNVPLNSNSGNTLGISNGGSKKCEDMLQKVHCVQRANGGRGVVFATGTPITNSITDIFVMQTYLQSGELSLLGLQNFDSWTGTFAEKTTEFEIDVDTSGYRLATRFAKFNNMPELSNLIASFADFHKVTGEKNLPLFSGYTDGVIARTSQFAEFLHGISQRADAVRGGRISRREDNMLKLTSDGRKAALDLRLVDDKQSFSYESKVARCAENIADIYIKTYEKKSTQLVFCDTSTPKKEFNIYDELLRILISMGIPSVDVAYIHEAATENEREKLLERVRTGDIRVLIGSTFKLGTGVNVQDKLIAIHHLDVPWRPSDMVQREGRILRQGNENKRIFIYRYITEGSFDAYSWQLLETKQRFISQLLSGSLLQRSGDDVDDTVLSYAEIKALAVGNPLIRKRCETANELQRKITLQKKYIESCENMTAELNAIPSKVEDILRLKQLCEEDFAAVTEDGLTKEQKIELRHEIYEAALNYEMQSEEKEIAFYRSFKVVLPPHMLRQRPYLYLVKGGRYTVELGDAEAGVLIRMDNVLEDLQRRAERMSERIAELNDKAEMIRTELEKDGGYAVEIEKLTEELKKIDKKLQEQ